MKIDSPFFHYSTPGNWMECFGDREPSIWLIILALCGVSLVISLFLFSVNFRRDPGDITLKPFAKVPVTEGGMSNHSYAILMHLTILLDFPFFPLGIAIPLILWLFKRDRDTFIDHAGRNILNFNLSLLLYSLLCVPFVFLFGLGMLGLFLLALLGLICPVLGAIRASEGRVYEYPFAISFLKPPAATSSEG